MFEIGRTSKIKHFDSEIKIKYGIITVFKKALK